MVERTVTHHPQEGIMPIRSRRRLQIFGPYCSCGTWGPWHHHCHPRYYPPPPYAGYYMEPPTQAEEKEDIKEHIEMLKEELAAAEARLKELEKA